MSSKNRIGNKARSIAILTFNNGFVIFDTNESVPRHFQLKDMLDLLFENDQWNTV